MATASQLAASRTQVADSLQKTRLNVHFRIRGKNPPPEITMKCTGLREAIKYAKRTFRYFNCRNPWIFQDSLQGRVYVLVDPEREKLDS